MCLICQSEVFQPRWARGIDKAALQSFALLLARSKRKLVMMWLVVDCLLSLHRWPEGRRRKCIAFSLCVVEIAIKVSNIKCFVFDLSWNEHWARFKGVKMAMVVSRLYLPHLHRQIGLKKTVFYNYQVPRGGYAWCVYWPSPPAHARARGRRRPERSEAERASDQHSLWLTASCVRFLFFVNNTVAMYLKQSFF